MRRLLICLAALCTAIAGSWLFVRFYPRVTGATVTSLPSSQSQPQWAYATEQIWIVDEIAEAIVNMAGGATTSRPASGSVVVAALPEQGALARFTIGLASGTQIPLAIEHHIWAPSSYAPVATALLGSATAVEAEAEVTEPAPTILTLTNPRASVIQQENARVSGLLRANPRSALAHDDAALVLAALAMRESAGPFSDPRRIMSRMTAHLTVARHLGGAAGPAGRLAETVLLTLAGRQREALERIGELEQLSIAGIRAWSRALRLRNTGDWRRTRSREGLTLLEQLETLRAIESTAGIDCALDFYEDLGKPAAPLGWSRALVQWGGTVDAAGAGVDTIEAELAEARELRIAFGGVAEDLPHDGLLRELNVETGLGPVQGAAMDSLWVVDWGTWAAASQRHLVMHVQSRYQHLSETRALPDEARAFAQDAEKNLSSLTLFSLVRPYLAYDRATYDRAMTTASDLCRRRPELVTDFVWKRLLQKPAFALVPEATPTSGPWFTPLVPAGTAYGAGHRAFGPSSEQRVSGDEVERLKALSPYRRQLMIESARQRHGNSPEYTVLQKEYGESAAYDAILARQVARAAANMPDVYVPLMRKAGELNPESLVELATYLLDRGKIAEARAVYEAWISRSREAIDVSHSAWWLVRHYFDTGQPRRAEALAKRMAEVQSYWGLVTLADLHDWRGETAEAKMLYEAAAKRYANDNERLAFYLRRIGRSPELKADADRLTRQIFPQGLERVGLREMKAAPVDGVSLLEIGTFGARNGLRKNDVVVGVDGLRVRNVRQYRVARGAGDAPDLTFLVWRDIGYLEVKGPFRYSWPISTVRDYKPTRLDGQS